MYYFYGLNIVSNLGVVTKHFRDKLNAKIWLYTSKSKISDTNKTQYRHYLLNNKRIVIDDVLDSFQKCNFDKSTNQHFDFKVFETDEFLDTENFDLIRSIIDLHVIYRLFTMKEYVDDNLDNIKDIYREKENLWYRGQTNASWPLIPSFFRNTDDTKIWTWEEILNEYDRKPSSPSLVSKLTEVDINPVDNPYKFIAFIQHAISYSPLIDFTKNSRVALSFALSNSAKISEFYKSDACIYELDISNFRVLTDKSEIDEKIRSSKIQIIKDGGSIMNIITNAMWIDLMSVDNESRVHLINVPTNDKMLYQKGVFALFDNVIVIGNEMFFSKTNIAFFRENLKKYIIKTDAKEKLLSSLLEDTPQYHYRYLSNPYLFLEDFYSVK